MSTQVKQQHNNLDLKETLIKYNDLLESYEFLGGYTYKKEYNLEKYSDNNQIFKIFFTIKFLCKPFSKYLNCSPKNTYYYHNK